MQIIVDDELQMSNEKLYMRNQKKKRISNFATRKKDERHLRKRQVTINCITQAHINGIGQFPTKYSEWFSVRRLGRWQWCCLPLTLFIVYCVASIDFLKLLHFKRKQAKYAQTIIGSTFLSFFKFTLNTNQLSSSVRLMIYVCAQEITWNSQLIGRMDDLSIASSITFDLVVLFCSSRNVVFSVRIHRKWVNFLLSLIASVAGCCVLSFILKVIRGLNLTR